MCSIANRKKWVRFPSQPGLGTRRKKKRKERMQIKKRNERIQVEDRNQICGVHNGKTYVKRQLVNPRYLGLKWGERAKTRKPCTKGADKQAKARLARSQQGKQKKAGKK
jgi:ribosomal protein S19